MARSGAGSAVAGARGRAAATKVSPRDGDLATRERVIDAAIACILERGFYRASSNEIARRAGVTWGVIQHYFGTRERLMLAVLEDGAQAFTDLVAAHEITGGTRAERIEDLLDLLCKHYANPAYLARLQVLLNLDHDPRTSVEVRKTMHDVAVQSYEHVRRLLSDALGPEVRSQDLATTIFLALRGFGLSQQLLQVQSYDTVQPPTPRLVARQRRVLASIVAAYVEGANVVG